MTARVFLKHPRSLKYCNNGVRAFCEKHGIEYSRLLKEGVPVDELSGIDDVMMKRVIDKAESDVQQD